MPLSDEDARKLREMHEAAQAAANALHGAGAQMQLNWVASMGAVIKHRLLSARAGSTATLTLSASTLDELDLNEYAAPPTALEAKKERARNRAVQLAGKKRWWNAR